MSAFNGLVKISKEKIKELKQNGYIITKDGTRYNYDENSLYTTTMFVPSALSELDIDVNLFGTKQKVVDELPISGIENIIYLVPNLTLGNNVKNAYIYSDERWEPIGNTYVDLEGYLKTNDIPEWAKSPVKPSYNVKEINGALSEIPENYLRSDKEGQEIEKEIYFKGLLNADGNISITTKGNDSTSQLKIYIDKEDGGVKFSHVNKSVDTNKEDYFLKITQDNIYFNGKEVILKKKNVFSGKLTKEFQKMEDINENIKSFEISCDEIGIQTMRPNSKLQLALSSIVEDDKIILRNIKIEINSSSIKGYIEKIDNEGKIEIVDIENINVYSLPL